MVPLATTGMKRIKNMLNDMLKQQTIANYIEHCLIEDGLYLQGGDITSNTFITANSTSTIKIVSRSNGIIGGIPIVQQLYATLDPSIVIDWYIEDGQPLATNSIIAKLSGNSRNILSGERTALNTLHFISNITTHANMFVQAVAGTGVKILDTRKTIPTLRHICKYATKLGGVENHRFNLNDAYMIKDNHIANSNLQATLNKITDNNKQQIIVECDSLEQVQLCCKKQYPITRILLDNMSRQQIKSSIEIINGRYLTEASGGINLDNVREIAMTGVDYISVGSITKTIPALIDIGFDY
jgi:nicotinate-nucleotide pyrophosphorylase (carboxylating)